MMKKKILFRVEFHEVVIPGVFKNGLLSVAVLLAGLVIGLPHAGAVELPGPLVSPDWLSKHLEEVVLLDVRADVNSFGKRSKRGSPVNPCGAGIKGKGPVPVTGHIPGAVLVRWSLVTAMRKIGGVKLDGWLPDKGDFQRLMQQSGVNGDHTIVVTGKGVTVLQAAIAARLYWTLKYYGHDRVALLDGGTAGWIQTGRKVKYGKTRIKRGNFKVRAERSELLATLDDAKALSGDPEGKEQLLDVRETAAYLGLTRNLKNVPPTSKGHIPGAKNFPLSFMANTMGPSATVYDQGTIGKVADLVEVDLGKPTTVFCNSGVMASLGWFVLHELLGNPQVRLYDGSMQEWSHRKMPITVMNIE